MATIRILLGIICLIAFSWRGLLGGSALNTQERVVDHKKLRGNHDTLTKPSTLIQIARSQLGVREKNGVNDGERVESYLKYAGAHKGDPWCAAFVSWVFSQTGYLQPKTAWSPALFPIAKRTNLIQPATLFGIYFPKLKRIAHCGFVERKDGNWLITIEGNTNIAGSREGDGVYRKRRSIKTIKYFANWTTKNGGEHD